MARAHIVSRPFHGLSIKQTPFPSAEALGYFHPVRFADAERDTFVAKPQTPVDPFPRNEISVDQRL
jgi:hypothetical protein